MSYVLFYKKEEKKILICRSYHGLKIESSSTPSSPSTSPRLTPPSPPRTPPRSPYSSPPRSPYSSPPRSPYSSPRFERNSPSSSRSDKPKLVEVKTYLKELSGIPISTELIKSEIETNIELFERIGIPNPRPKKLNNNLIYIGDNDKSYMNNFIGGQIEDLENSKTALIRELQEELFINCNDEDKKIYIKDIESKLTNFVIDGSRTIYLVDFDSLKDVTKEFLIKLVKEDAGEHITILSKLETFNGIPDVEMGEIHSLKWSSLEKLKSGSTTKKFFGGGVDDSVLEKKIKEIFYDTNSLEKKYYIKYVKYKNKYLQLKNKRM